MDSIYRKFCPKNNNCKEICEKCKLISGKLGHEINKRYLKSIGKICLCAECCDK